MTLPQLCDMAPSDAEVVGPSRQLCAVSDDPWTDLQRGWWCCEHSGGCVYTVGQGAWSSHHGPFPALLNLWENKAMEEPWTAHEGGVMP